MRLSVTYNSKVLVLCTLILCVVCSIYYLSVNNYHITTSRLSVSVGRTNLLNVPVVNEKPEVLKETIQSKPEVVPSAQSNSVQPGSVKGVQPSKDPGTSFDSHFLVKPELKGATVITRSETSWSRDDKSCDGDNSFKKVTFHSPAGDTPMYVHPKGEDQWVSGAVIGGGIWEGSTVKKFHSFLKEHPDFQFIDIAANIGMYGLTIAKLGRKVILVEPLLSNVQKLCHSVCDGQFQNAIIIHNAMSSKRFSVGFGTYKGNIGGTYVRNVTSEKEETAYAILLDDLLEVLNFTKVAMKIDVETHEPQVLQGGDNFFSKVNVLYLMLEWHNDKKETGKTVIEFLTRHNMAPYNPNTEQSLDPADYKKWPGDILWKKKV